MSAMFPNEVIATSAWWLARHEWHSGDDDSGVSSRLLQACRFERWTRRLHDVASKAISVGEHRIGASVPCRPVEGDACPRAVIHIVDGRAFGYVAGEDEPSFLWPPPADV